jgi:hypothetical protein
MVAGQKFWTDDAQKTDYSTFASLLHQRSGSGCKFPSDLVYSIYGAAFYWPNIEVNYEMPSDKVFATTAVEIIKTSGNLGIISRRQKTYG